MSDDTATDTNNGNKAEGKELNRITLVYSDGSEQEIKDFKLGNVTDTKLAAAATSGEIGSDKPDGNDANPTGGKSKGGKKSRKPKSKRIRVRKTRRRKH